VHTEHDNRPPARKKRICFSGHGRLPMILPGANRSRRGGLRFLCRKIFGLM
jgi:hypothetical protein